jgi:hypothetical protein
MRPANREYIERHVTLIENGVKAARRPPVYFSLGHPLIAIFGDKFECNLVEIAGGRCVNKDLERDDRPGITIPPEALVRLNPEIILVTGAIGYPLADFTSFARRTASGISRPSKIRGSRACIPTALPVGPIGSWAFCRWQKSYTLRFSHSIWQPLPGNSSKDSSA